MQSALANVGAPTSTAAPPSFASALLAPASRGDAGNDNAGAAAPGRSALTVPDDATMAVLSFVEGRSRSATGPLLAGMDDVAAEEPCPLSERRIRTIPPAPTTLRRRSTAPTTKSQPAEPWVARVEAAGGAMDSAADRVGIVPYVGSPARNAEGGMEASGTTCAPAQGGTGIPMDAASSAAKASADGGLRWGSVASARSMSAPRCGGSSGARVCSGAKGTPVRRRRTRSAPVASP